MGRRSNGSSGDLRSDKISGYMDQAGVCTSGSICFIWNFAKLAQKTLVSTMKWLSDVPHTGLTGLENTKKAFIF